jgi:hypothetical protein
MATQTAAAPPRRSFLARFWGFIMFLLVVGAGSVAVYAFVLLRQEQDAREALERRVAAWDPKFEAFKGVVREVDRHLSSVVYQEVDLSGLGWQPIAGGFYVTDLGVSPEGKGVKIVGKIINPTSVTHEDAAITVRIDDHKASFALPKVTPGIAEPFEVTLPDVAPAAAKRAYMSLDGSTISFASSATGKAAGKAPVDTDKLLK